MNVILKRTFVGLFVLGLLAAPPFLADFATDVSAVAKDYFSTSPWFAAFHSVVTDMPQVEEANLLDLDDGHDRTVMLQKKAHVTTDLQPSDEAKQRRDSPLLEVDEKRWATSVASRLACKGNSATFNAGYGLCSTYSLHNKFWCKFDQEASSLLYAWEVCEECQKCRNAPPTQAPPPNGTNATMAPLPPTTTQTTMAPPPVAPPDNSTGNDTMAPFPPTMPPPPNVAPPPVAPPDNSTGNDTMAPFPPTMPPPPNVAPPPVAPPDNSTGNDTMAPFPPTMPPPPNVAPPPVAPPDNSTGNDTMALPPTMPPPPNVAPPPVAPPDNSTGNDTMAPVPPPPPLPPLLPTMAPPPPVVPPGNSTGNDTMAPPISDLPTGGPLDLLSLDSSGDTVSPEHSRKLRGFKMLW